MVRGSCMIKQYLEETAMGSRYHAVLPQKLKIEIKIHFFKTSVVTMTWHAII